MPKQISEPMLLVAHEKHGERYFHIPNAVALHTAALRILTERYVEGYWYLEPEKPKAEDLLSKEQIAGLPEGSSIRKQAEQDLKRFARAKRDYEYELESWALIQKAVETKDGAKAWACLQDRSDGEYERLSLERYENYEDSDDEAD